jgi:hypothetical protein
MADDDIPFANGAGPAPRRRMYAAPFGSLQTADPPSIQYGDRRIAGRAARLAEVPSMQAVGAPLLKAKS